MTVSEVKREQNSPPQHRLLLAGRLESILDTALAIAGDPSIALDERADMLMEVAMGLQTRPKTVSYLQAAVFLYDRALELCNETDLLLSARIQTRKATALQALPSSETKFAEEALLLYQIAIPILRRLGLEEEVAEADMNLGLTLQSLAACGKARMRDAIAAYQRALRVFDGKRFPVEFAILQNNLATAFLSVAFSDEKAPIREALAVQCFEDALNVVSLIEQPTEYAMLQNNLGNALQQTSTGKPFEHRLRAIAAYDEALRVRTRSNTPVQYANTIANKASCLLTLPDDLERPERGNKRNSEMAARLYQEACAIFVERGEIEKATSLSEAMAEMEQERSLSIDETG